jgi:hypothetical protein
MRGETSNFRRRSRDFCIMDRRTKSTVSGYRSRKYCCICSNYRGKTVDGRVVSLHRFPSDKEKRKTWLQRARLVRKDFVYTKHSYVCSTHFVNGCGPSANHPLPSLFPNKVFKTSVCSDKSHRVYFSVMGGFRMQSCLKLTGMCQIYETRLFQVIMKLDYEFISSFNLFWKFNISQCTSEAPTSKFTPDNITDLWIWYWISAL